jgi:riboflavin synthase
LFTGIVETTGTIEALGPLEKGARRISISSALPLATVPKGGSIAVDGVCLTLVGRRGRRFDADLGPETLSLTTLGSRRAGDVVHLERPLRIGDPLGGHLVDGHVDGTGTVARTRRSGDCLTIEITAPPPVAPFLAVKGSITVDGVSLTVNAVKGPRFSITLIPHTLEVTRLGSLDPGSKVNLEADLIAKHVAHLLSPLARKRARRAPNPKPAKARKRGRHV